MNDLLGHNSALQGYTAPGTTQAKEMNFVMNHAPGAGSIAQPVDRQSSALPLYHGRPLSDIMIDTSCYQILKCHFTISNTKRYPYNRTICLTSHSYLIVSKTNS